MASDIDPERLYGTWRLIGSRAVDGDGQPIRDPWGPVPMGRLVLDRSGRMMAVLCDGRTHLPDGESRLYSSYCGNFEVTGGVLTTVVDAASDPSRIGSVQERQVALAGGQLVLTPPRRADGELREIVWELEAAAPA
jgi:Lipocalin-like domain